MKSFFFHDISTDAQWELEPPEPPLEPVFRLEELNSTRIRLQCLSLIRRQQKDKSTTMKLVVRNYASE